MFAGGRSVVTARRRARLGIRAAERRWAGSEASHLAQQTAARPARQREKSRGPQRGALAARPFVLCGRVAVGIDWRRQTNKQTSMPASRDEHRGDRPRRRDYSAANAHSADPLLCPGSPSNNSDTLAPVSQASRLRAAASDDDDDEDKPKVIPSAMIRRADDARQTREITTAGQDQPGDRPGRRERARSPPDWFRGRRSRACLGRAAASWRRVGAAGGTMIDRVAAQARRHT
jgi:hypothetical protein